MKLKVVLINLWDRGGMLHYASQLANALSELVEVAMIIPESTPDESRQLVRAEVDLVTFPALTGPTANPLRILSQVIHMAGMTGWIFRKQPKIIHVVSAHFWMIFILPVLSRFFPIVSTLHDVRPHPGMDDSIRKRMEIWALRSFSKRIFVHGEKLRADVLARAPERTVDDVVVVPHGDYAFFRAWNKPVREEPGAILFFGRIREYKGLEVLLDAFRIVVDRVPDARLVIAGEGSLNGYAGLSGPSAGIEIHNRYIEDHEVGAFFDQASVVVCPYREASQSGVVPIAYAFKKPVIVTRTGSLPEVVADGVTGLVVPPDDPDRLADALCLLLNDPALRKRLGTSGYQEMKAEMGWGAIAETTCKVYNHLAARADDCTADG